MANQPITAVYLQAGTAGYYRFVQDGGLAMTQLPGGSITVQQGGSTFAFTPSTGAPATSADAAVLALADPTAAVQPVLAAIAALSAPGTLGAATVNLAGHTGGWLEWHPNAPTDTPPTITFTGGTPIPMTLGTAVTS